MKKAHLDAPVLKPITLLTIRKKRTSWMSQTSKAIAMSSEMIVKIGKLSAMKINSNKCKESNAASSSASTNLTNLAIVNHLKRARATIKVTRKAMATVSKRYRKMQKVSLTKSFRA